MHNYSLFLIETALNFFNRDCLQFKLKSRSVLINKVFFTSSPNFKNYLNEDFLLQFKKTEIFSVNAFYNSNQVYEETLIFFLSLP